jgi:nitroreductase
VTAVAPLDDTVRTRRSVRQYLPNAVPRALLEQVIERATWAPSAGNRQDWEFVVVTSESRKAEMASAVREAWNRLLDSPDVSSVAEAYRAYGKYFDWFPTAPAVIVVTAKAPDGFMSALCGEHARDVSGGHASAAMAAQNLMLVAHGLGLGTCCLTGPLAAQDDLRRLLSIGSRRDIVCLVTIGYPAETPTAPGRKPLGEIVRYVE